MDGLKKAILYSLKPHELGYCGPLNKKQSVAVLRQYVWGQKYAAEEIIKLLKKFQAATSYYRLIAKANQEVNIFHPQVIEAYWLGNKWLKQVNRKDLKALITSDFVSSEFLKPEQAQYVVNNLPAGVVPHHSCHVFFVGSITGRVKITPEVQDKCRVGWGVVTRIFPDINKLEVKTEKLFPRKIKTKIKIDWDKKFTPQLKSGDIATFHWGRVCEKISQRQLKNLIKYTMINYNASYEVI